MSNFIKPIMGMVGVTVGVWGYMYVKRLIHLQRHHIQPQSIGTPNKWQTLLPDSVNW